MMGGLSKEKGGGGQSSRPLDKGEGGRASLKIPI